MRQALWRYPEKARRAFTPRQRGKKQRKSYVGWLTKGLLSVIFLFMVWASSYVAPLSEYLRLVFVPGAAGAGPWSTWLDWQPQGEEVLPVWLLLTGRIDAAMFDAPVQGRLQSDGARGVYIEATAGALVRAVLPGSIAAVDPRRGEVKVYHGSTMYTAYLGCTDIAVSQGDRVNTGDILGRVGQSGRLLFSVSQDGRPIDPLPRLRDHGQVP